MFKFKSVIVFPLLVLFMSACGGNELDDAPLSKEKVQAVMYDLYLFEGVAAVNHLSVSDSTKIPAYNAILNKHEVTLSEFDSAMVWYGRHLKVLSEMHKEVFDRIAAKRDSLTKK